MSATLNAESRAKLGSRHARRLRDAGRIPATIQGGDGSHLDVSIDAHEFWTARRAHEHLFDIQVEGGSEAAVVDELQWSSLGDEILHVEFRRVKLGEKTETEVGLEFVGHPKGGQLNHLLTSIPVLSLPSEIPDVIEVKVEGLEIGAHVRAGDLVLPEGVELAIEPETEVAVISAPRGEAVEEAPEAAEEEAPEGEAPAAAPPAEEE